MKKEIAPTEVDLRDYLVYQMDEGHIFGFQINTLYL